MSKKQPPRAKNNQPQQQARTFLTASQRIEVSSQLLPPSQELRDYDAVLPGAAERIIAMAEREQSERHRAQAYALETLRLDNIAERNAEKRGQWMAVIFLWGNLIAATILAFYDLIIPASILAGASVANVLNTVIIRTKK